MAWPFSRPLTTLILAWLDPPQLGVAMLVCKLWWRSVPLGLGRQPEPYCLEEFRSAARALCSHDRLQSIWLTADIPVSDEGLTAFTRYPLRRLACNVLHVSEAAITRISKLDRLRDLCLWQYGAKSHRSGCTHDGLLSVLEHCHHLKSLSIVKGWVSELPADKLDRILSLPRRPALRSLRLERCMAPVAQFGQMFPLLPELLLTGTRIVSVVDIFKAFGALKSLSTDQIRGLDGVDVCAKLLQECGPQPLEHLESPQKVASLSVFGPSFAICFPKLASLSLPRMSLAASCAEAILSLPALTTLNVYCDAEWDDEDEAMPPRHVPTVEELPHPLDHVTRLSGLKSLQAAPSLPTRLLESIAQACGGLETLAIPAPASYDFLSRCPNAGSLQLFHERPLPPPPPLALGHPLMPLPPPPLQPLTDKALGHLSRFWSLKHLRIADQPSYGKRKVNVTSKGLCALFDNCRLLEEVLMSTVPIPDPAIACLARNCRSLQVLSFSPARMSDEGMRSLSDVKSLCKLSLPLSRECVTSKVTDAGIKALGSGEMGLRLNRLLLTGFSKVTDAPFGQAFTGFVNLKSLTLTGMKKVTSAALVGIAASCTALEFLNVSGNHNIGDLNGFVAVMSRCPKLSTLALRGSATEGDHMAQQWQSLREMCVDRGIRII